MCRTINPTAGTPSEVQKIPVVVGQGVTRSHPLKKAHVGPFFESSLRKSGPDHCSISRFRKENEGKIEVGRADAGYWNEADLERECGYEIWMATEKDWKRRKRMREEPPPRGRIPKPFSAMERMERKRRTKRGSEEYEKRSQTIEVVFGQIKQGRGIDSFYGRELLSARGEWKLICGTHNLRKLFARTLVERN